MAIVLTLVQTKHKRNNTKNTVQTIQNTINTLHILPKYAHITNPTHTHAHTLQNKLKQPQYKLKQTQYKIYPNESHSIIKHPQYKVTLMNMFHTHKISYEI